MTYEEAIKAIETADDHFAIRSNEPLAQQNIGGKMVNLIFEKDGTRWDYGIPSMYELDKKHLDELEKWWKGKYPKTGVMLPPQLKGGVVYQVNLQWETENERLFNLHLSVTR